MVCVPVKVMDVIAELLVGIITISVFTTGLRLPGYNNVWVTPPTVQLPGVAQLPEVPPFHVKVVAAQALLTPRSMVKSPIKIKNRFFKGICLKN